MGGKMTFKQAITPLFERLLDEDMEIPFEKNPKRFSSLEELYKSIANDLSRLLNTRIPTIWRDYSKKNNSVTPFSYGVNLTDAVSSENPFDMRTLETRVKEVVEQFESRLTSVKVNVISIGKDPSTLFVNVDAIVTTENRRVPLSFPIVVGSGAA
jgi:type VI secretion system lysozyme-like protein